MAKAHNLDEFGRHKAAERYGSHATTKHGRMAMDAGGATSQSGVSATPPAPEQLNLNPTSS